MQLTLERLFSEPELGGSLPTALKISPDGQRVTYLATGDEDLDTLHLFEFNLETHKSQRLVDAGELLVSDKVLSDEEKSIRERKRIRQGGITEYHFSPDGQSILFPVQGNLFLYTLANGQRRQVTDDSTFETDIRFSPDSRHLAFVRSKNLWLMDLTDGSTTALTSDGNGPISNGLAEFIAQEEMQRFDGYWWSPDSSRLVYTRVDESPVQLSQRYEIDAAAFNVIDQRYPYAGTPNANVTLHLADVSSGSTRELPLPVEDEDYLARVDWLDAGTLIVQVLNREQTELKLLRIDVDTGTTRTIMHETSDVWINLHDNLKPINHGDKFVWTSERTGYSHVYVVDRDGKEISALTSGNWVVTNVLAVTGDQVFFLGYRETPLEQQLYRVGLDGDIRRLTESGYYHQCVIDKSGHYFIDHFSNVGTPPRVVLRTPDGKIICDLNDNELIEDHPFFPFAGTCEQIEFGELSAADGQSLHYRLLPPLHVEQGQKYPVIVFVYGGPHAQLVTRQWLSPWQHYMASRGYGVFTLDNRGSANRGIAFEQPIHRRLGNVEVQDQLVGVDYLKSLPWVNPDRIGVFGHSYGGYMTLMLMSQAPDVFRAGVSVAPVSDWYLYDTHYTERYLGHPEDNPEGYEQSAVFPYLRDIRGALLLIHGMADDNVLFLHTTRLYKALQDANIAFETMAYPGAKHGLVGKSVNLHRYGTMDRFFDRELRA